MIGLSQQNTLDKYLLKFNIILLTEIAVQIETEGQIAFQAGREQDNKATSG
jgi:hypothetical protein